VIWLCPKCRKKLTDLDGVLKCDAGHSFDRARQGYLYLLLANQKHSREPGDNSEMVLARNRFLRAGYYQSLPDRIAALISPYLDKQKKRSTTVLDLGCGEGYYLESMASELANRSNADIRCYGIDLSKHAIKKAAVSSRSMIGETMGQLNFDYAVASTFNIPLGDHEIDLALNIFAPAAADEVARVLKPEGLLVRVMPGPRHLFQLKQCLYDKPELHTLSPIEAPYRLVCRESLSFKIHLMGQTIIQDLLKMTPLYYHGKREAKTALSDMSTLDLDVDFDIQVLSLKSAKGFECSGESPNADSK